MSAWEIRFGCPACRAAPGEPCRTPAGNITALHSARGRDQKERKMPDVECPDPDDHASCEHGCPLYCLGAVTAQVEDLAPPDQRAVLIEALRNVEGGEAAGPYDRSRPLGRAAHRP